MTAAEGISTGYRFTMESERDELRVPKFRGSEHEDFELWSLRLSSVLESKDLAGVVYDASEVPEDATAEEKAVYQRKLRKARAIIITSLGDKPLRVVQSVEHPKEMVQKLIERYAASTTANKIAVMTSLIHTRYDGVKDMGEYISEMESLFNKLAAMGSSVDSDMQVAILLVSLSSEESLSSTVSAIKTMDVDKATWEYVTGRLIEEVRSQKLAGSAEVMASSTKAAAIRQRKHISDLRCFKCNKKGHIARNCKSKKGSRNVEKDENSGVRAALVRKEACDAAFIVDSGCTQHITNDIQNFTTVCDIKPIRVHLADDRVVEAKKEGTVRINLFPRKKGKRETKLMLS